MKKFIKNVCWVTIPTLLFCLLIAEFLVFRVFIPACEPPLYVFDEHFKLLHFKPHTAGLFTIGRFARVRGHWRSNNCGWNSPVDYVPGIGKKRPLIAIIGDSYVEAFQVDVNQGFPARLQQLTGDDSLVYSFGISDAPFSQYLHISRYVNQVFNPQTLVINVVHNDFDESLAVLRRTPRFLQIARQPGGFVEIPPQPFQNRAFLSMCRGSAVFRYVEMNCGLTLLIRNISLWLNSSPQPPIYNANINVEAVTRERDLIRQGIRFMVAEIRAENADKRVIIQMDAPRYDIYAHNLANSNVWWMHELMRDACRDNHLEFLDLTESFRQHFETHGRKFESAQLGDFHWNRLAHAIVARALWARIKETGALIQASGTH